MTLFLACAAALSTTFTLQSPRLPTSGRDGVGFVSGDAHQRARVQLLKHLSAVYLFYLAYATWRAKAAFVVAAPPAASMGRIVTKALLLNILRPKLTIFFLAFLPQFITYDSVTPLRQLLTLSSVFMAMAYAVFVLYGRLAHAFRRLVLDSPRVQVWLRRSFAAAFAGLGVDLALTED